MLRQSVNGVRKQWRLWRSFRGLKRLGIIAYFDGYPPDAIAPQYDDLFGLYLITLQRKPSVILELGGGYSTFVFAHAVRQLHSQGHQVTLFSVDESDYWQQVVKNHMPRELLPFVSFWRSDPKLTELNGETVSVFSSLPATTANLVYVDGGLVPGNRIGGDAVGLERNAPNDFAVLVDGRKQTVAFLKRAFAKRYAVGRGPIALQTLFTRADHAASC